MGGLEKGSLAGNSPTEHSSAPCAEVMQHDFSGMKAVVIGGGTGAPVSLRTLLSLSFDTSAVVSMADDGGSTGILRDEANVTPPGDIRKCIAALAANPDDPLTRAFVYRLPVARNHTLGNLMLSTLEQTCSSFPEAISICERLLQAKGHAYPSTLNLVRLVARTRDGATIEGEALAGSSHTALEHVELVSDAPIVAYEPALNAIREADLIVLGPGSLFTSIISSLIVPGVIDAIRESKGAVVFVCSLADQQGETWGLTAREHVEALLDHGMEGLLDFVLLHSKLPVRPSPMSQGLYASATGDESAFSTLDDLTDFFDESLDTAVRPVRFTYRDVQAIQATGPVVMVRDLSDQIRPTWHDPERLRRAFQEVIYLCRSRQR